VSDNEPQFEVVGHREGDHIVWHDGSPPTPVPADLNTKPADGVCRSAEEEE
jgi:hypothetical protein